jgi:hypothetical protein
MTMPSDPTVLFEGQLTNAEALIYTAPADRIVNVTIIEAVNITSGAVTVRVDRVPAGGSDGTTKEVVNESVAANTTAFVPSGGEELVVVLEPGDELYASAGSNTAIDLTVSGTIQEG